MTPAVLATRLRLVPVFLMLAALCLPVAGARAQDTSLLLGLRFMEPISQPLPYYAGSADSLSRPAYKTFLISRRNGRLALSGEVSGLSVPREQGYWQVGTKRSIYNNWVEDFTWSAPEGQTPEYSGIQTYNGEYCDGHRTQTVHFAGADFLALEIQSGGYCEEAAHPWYYRTFAVVPIDSTTHLGVPISQFLGGAGYSALRKGAESLRDTLPEEDLFLYVEEPDEASWNLARRQGRWVLRGRLDPSSVAYSETADFDVDAPVPQALVRRNQLQPPWPAVRAFAPDAIDAFSSPNGDLVAILRPAQLTVHPVASGRIGPAALTFGVPEHSTAVMTRWAVGPVATQWAGRFSQAAQAAMGPR